MPQLIQLELDLKIQKKPLKQNGSKPKTLLSEFESFWIHRKEIPKDQFAEALKTFEKLAAPFLDDPTQLHNMNTAEILDALYSVKHGRVIGHRLPNLLALANNTLEYHREHTKVFTWALQVYGQTDKILQQDNKGVFKRRIAQYKVQSKQKNPAYRQDPSLNSLFEILFPELKDHLAHPNKVN